MFLSIIIPTRNRANLLKKALDSLLAQNYSQDYFEIIVINNGSTDHTHTLCREYVGQFKYFQLIEDSRPGLHVGRHAGLKAAQGNILVYGDDDIVASPMWLEGIAEAFADPAVVLVGGGNLPDFETSPPEWVQGLWRRTRWGKALYEYSILDFGDTIQMISPFYVWGCNFSIRKTILEKSGGFHPDAMPKEHILYRGDGETAVAAYVATHGYKTCYHPKASIRHWVSTERMTPDYLYWRAFIQGISDSYTVIRHSNGITTKDYCFSKSRQSLRWLRTLPAGSLRFNMNKTYWQGFFQHRASVRADNTLLDWVLQPEYWD